MSRPANDEKTSNTSFGADSRERRERDVEAKTLSLGADSRERRERDVEAKTLSLGADSREQSERYVGATIQIDRRGVSEHATPQSGHAVAFSANC